MERNYTTIEGTSRGYKVLVALLGVMVGVFIVSFLVAYLKGQQVWGVSNIIPWGQLITFYIFFIGLSAGAIIISSLFHPGDLTLMLVYLWLIFEGKKRLAALVGTVDVLWAVAVHMGTGAIFGLIGNREIFFSPIKPFEFLTAALTSGTSLIILTAVVTFKLTRRVIQDELIFSLGRLLTSMILILVVMVFIDKLTHLYFPNREAAVYLLTGDYWWIFWIFQIGMGIVLPLILLIHPKTKKTLKGVVCAAASVGIGVFGERAALVIPGTAHPQPFFPGQIEGPWGEPGIFPITSWDTPLRPRLGSFVGLLFVLGLRYLEILPARTGESLPAGTGLPARFG